MLHKYLLSLKDIIYKFIAQNTAIFLHFKSQNINYFISIGLSTKLCKPPSNKKVSVALFMCCTEQDLDLPNNAFIVLFDKAAWCQILINNCLKKNPPVFS